MTKQEKNDVIEVLKGKFAQYNNFYVTDTESLSVSQVTKLRSHCFNKQVEMKVAKNTLIRLALAEDGKYTVADKILEGSTAVVFVYDDPIAPAKLIRKYFEKDKRPALKLAIIEGQSFDGSQLKAVSELPTREDMIAAIVGSLHAPISGIVGSINAVMRDVASLVEEVAKKQGE